MDSRLIEFVGLPGAGKSTIAEQLAAEVRGSGRTTREPTKRYAAMSPLYRRLTRVLMAFSQGVKNPQLGITSVNLICSPPRRSWSGAIRSVLNWLHLAELYAPHDREEVAVFDQGLVQALWSIRFMADCDALIEFRPMIESLLSQWGSVSLVVVGADVQAIKRRLDERPRGDPQPIDVGDPQSLRRAVRILEEVKSELNKIVESMDTVQKIEIDNSSDGRLREKVDEVYQSI